jgi:hypothetical protein
MDDIKLAFETVIVGLLALPWLLLLFHITFCLILKINKSDLLGDTCIYLTGSKEEKEVSTTVFGVLLLALTYFVGSVLVRTAERVSKPAAVLREPSPQEIDFGKVDNLVAAAAQDGFECEETEASHLLECYGWWHGEFLPMHEDFDQRGSVVF